MLKFLEQRWFLLLILGGGLVVWLRPEWLRWTVLLDPRVVVAFALFLSAWGLESRSLYRAVMRPWPALWALVLSYGFLPGCAWLVAPLLPSEDYRIGLLITASVPTTLASAVLWTRMAGGNEATALLGTMLTTATSWLATTACLAWTIGATVAVDPFALMRSLFVVLVVPVAAGQIMRAYAPLARFATEQKPLLGVVGRLLVYVIMLKAALDVADRFGDPGDSLALSTTLLTAVICVGTHLAALAVGFWGGLLFGFDRADRIGVAFACSQKTLPVALFLFDAYFRAYPLAVLPIAFFHIGQLVVDTFIADAWVKHPARSTPIIPQTPPGG